MENLRRKGTAPGFPIFISIGKTNSSKTTGLEPGIKDYYDCLKKVIASGLGDCYEINISCPNTFGGESFTTPERLKMLLEKLSTLSVDKPIFLKMPINLLWEDFRALLDIALLFSIRGITIGNLNKNRADKSICDHIPEYVQGNISGKPTWKLSNDLIFKTYQHYGDKLLIIGVGGIFSAEDAYEKIKLGACLVEIITGMIYEGRNLSEISTED